MIKNLSLFVLIIFVLSLLLYLNQRRLMYFPLKESVKPADFAADNMTVVSLSTSDGLSLGAWYHPAQVNQATIVFYHGNAGHLGYRTSMANALIAQGLGVLLMSYRGYANNPGKPTEQGLYQDGHAAINYLLSQGVKPTCLVLYGESLGSGVATKIATKYDLGAVILQSPYTSFVDLAKIHYPWLMLQPWDKYDSFQRIDKIKAPLLIIHGQDDRLVPITLGQRLYEKALEPKQFLQLAGKGHNNLWDDNVIIAIKQFIHKNIKNCSV